ncbi:MAG: hypothetical protein ACXVEE_03250 [Polyangiales bacterium]
MARRVDDTRRKATTGHGVRRASTLAVIAKSEFGVTSRGEAASLYTLENASGMRVEITNYGGIVRSLTAPDRDGVFADVVLGYRSLAE